MTSAGLLPDNMYSLGLFIVAMSTAMTGPGITIPEPDPLPIVVAIELPRTEIEEVKPIPNPSATQKEVACNCYNILKERFGEVPSMDAVIAQATETFGNVAVFRYPATPDWPTGIPHVAIVTGRTTDGMFEIEEYNYHRCTHSHRLVSFTDVRLIGFTNL